MLLRPTYTIDSIYHLNENQLKKMGIKAIFADLDNTLLAWNVKQTAQEMDELNHRLQKVGIKLVVISNNTFTRVDKVLAPYQISFLARAKKPLPFGIRKALRHFHLRREEVLMVGDQLITDMQAGNLAGVRSVLVRPLVSSDRWNTQINRFFERFVFKFWAVSGRKIKFREYLK